MVDKINIQSALISVYHKQGLEPIILALKGLGADIYSTGGTAAYIRDLGAEVHEVADLTGYPSILGGRVKTLHPKVHGGILARRDDPVDQQELAAHDIPTIDLVIVDLYPFEETVASGAGDDAIIEKIDIGGIALIRAAAKNFRYVAIVPSAAQYAQVGEWLQAQQGALTLAQRKALAGAAFNVSSHYDTHIHNYFQPKSDSLKVSFQQPAVLRYGENPHQKGYYYGKLEDQFEQLNGKPLSYNNLVDIEGALQLIDEFEEPFFAVIKHTNPCGCATGSNMLEAWQKALAGDPVSAFGGILACNGTIDASIAEDIKEKKLFFEVMVADAYEPAALNILAKSKNRILLKRKTKKSHSLIVKSLLDGYLVQQKDKKELKAEDLEYKSSRKATSQELSDVLFGDKVVKHLKSNAIAIVKNGQLIGSGVGQTSRIDALAQAIFKAKDKGFDLKGSTLASDAFFPFSDGVEMAHAAGIEVVVQPGGSIRDEDTIKFCENQGMCLIFTGTRHFKH